MKPIVLLLLTAALVLLYKIDKPFWGHHDFNGVYYGNAARNLLRFPLEKSKLGQVVFLDQPTAGETPHQFYTHHPPLLVWILAISYGLFGISEVSTRLVPVLFSLLTLLFFYRLVRRCSGQAAAVISSVLWIITPLFIYFGKMAVHEPLIVFFFIYSFDRYQIFTETKKYRDYTLLLIGLFLGTIVSWAGYYPPLIIILAYLWERRRFTYHLLPIMLLPVISFTLHIFHVFFLTGSPVGGGLVEIFRARSAGAVGWPEFIRNEFLWVSTYFTKPVIFLSVFGLSLVVVQRQKVAVLAFLFFLFGILHMLLFRQSVYGHDYQIYYLLPFFSFTAAIIVKAIFERAPIIGLIVFLVAVFSSLKTSLPFTKELVTGSPYHQSVEIGKFINSHSQVGEKVFVDTSNFNGRLDGWIISFYADRVNTSAPFANPEGYDRVFTLNSFGEVN